MFERRGSIVNYQFMKKTRCDWCGDDPLYVKYHDDEWGKPVYDDKVLFEFLILEGAQAGLSWLTVLKKRENYRKAFLNFDFHKVAPMPPADEEKLLSTNGIIRNRLKIRSAVVNAQKFIEIIDEYGSFYNYILGFLPEGKRIVNNIPEMKDIPVTSPVSDALSKDLKKRGFKFVGSTIIYSFLQATGFIDDHLNSCPHKSKFR